MAIEALCPTCGAVFNLKDDFQGKKVRCKKCEQIFTVGGQSKARDRDDSQSVQSRSSPASKRSARDDDDDDRVSRKKSRVGQDDDDDDRASSRKSKRVYHDDDEDDDDRRPARKKSGGGSGTVIAIVAGIFVLLLLVCGGAGYGIYRLATAAADAADQAQQDLANNMNNPPVFGPNGGFVGFDKTPHDLNEALTFLKGNDVNERRGAANWLANQPLDAGRQKGIATALEPLVKDPDDNLCTAGAKAMKVWGTKENGPALTNALKSRLPGQNRPFMGEDQKQLMNAIAQVKYEPGAEVIMEFLPNAFSGGEAEAALGRFGSGAEKVVVKAFDHPDGGARGKARGLLRRYGTKPTVILDQVTADLNAIEQESSKAAVDWLSKRDSDDALQLANAEPGQPRRAAVARGLNHLIDAPPVFTVDTVLLAARRWGTKDNVPSLIHTLETSPSNKAQAADALIGIGPACETEVRKLLDHPDGGVRDQAKRILKSVNPAGGGDVEITEALADLKSGDFGRMTKAGRFLQRARVDEKQRPVVVAALLDSLKGKGDGQTEQPARALTVWATKDDGPAVALAVGEMEKTFCVNSRRVLLEWLGTQKVEKGIPVLVETLADNFNRSTASKALQTMGPDLGEKIEAEVLKVNAGPDRQLLLECVKILGAVGTKKGSLPALTAIQGRNKNDRQLSTACVQAAAQIDARGK